LHIHGIALDTGGNLLVVDEGKNEVQKFDNQGNFITRWGTEGEDTGQFSSKIEGISVDVKKTFYVMFNYFFKRLVIVFRLPI
jgi:tripartite motif-containing protein 71